MASARSRAAHQHVVLVVEDSDTTRDSLALLLQLEGYRVAAVANGLEALHLMQTLGLRPCAIVADLIMPKMDGFTLRAEQLKYADLAAIPVIALTAHEGLRRHAVETGFAAALLKPCDFGELFGLIETHCSSIAARVRAGVKGA